MKKNILFIIILAIFSQIVISQDIDLRSIKPPKGKTLVYIVRPAIYGFAIKFHTYCNGHDIGYTKGKSFLFTITDPGELLFSSQSENKVIITINAKPDETYFILQEVKTGLAKARTQLHLLNKDQGRKELLSCKLSKGNLYEYRDYQDFMEENLTATTTDTIIKEKIVYVENHDGKDPYVFEKLSEVDNDIPVNNKENKYRFALIIGNEDYASYQTNLTAEINVDYARNDASAFKDYAANLLGIPEKNIVFLLDATSGKMAQAISKMNLIIKNTNGQAEVFVYYAGHGLPDEVTKEPYLIPVDVSGKNVQNGIKLQDLYSSLTEYHSKRIVVFIDACFSGGARNQGLVAARGVKLKPKENILSGNLIVFTSSSGSQSSLPFKDQNHGLYTFYLLKKLKETSGDITYQELSSYLKDQIPLQSVLENSKEQTPQTNISSSIINEWTDWKINQ